MDRVIRKRNKTNRNLFENINIKEIYNRKNEKNYFLIMDRLGDSLRNIHEKLCNKFSFKTAAQIGLQMVNVLEKVHDCGLVYNDIKPDNILIGDIEIIPIIDGDSQPNVDIVQTDCSSVRLIDFAYSTAFNDTDGQHIKDNVPDKFQGSILFASKNAFNFTSTSRRDDFISLCYLLIYLVNENQLGFITQVEDMGARAKFNYIKEKKNSCDAKALCGTQRHNPDTFRFHDFAEEIFSYGFEEKPNYAKMRFLLTKALIDSNCNLDKKYDWFPLLSNTYGYGLRVLDISNESIDKQLLKEIALDENVDSDKFVIRKPQ